MDGSSPNETIFSGNRPRRSLMSWRRFALPLTVIGAVLAVSTSSLAGSPDDPELADSADDVSYGLLYTGDTDHAYIDFIAFWLENDGSNVTATLMLGDTTALDPPPADWAAYCRVLGRLMLDGEENGYLHFRWTTVGDTRNLLIHLHWLETTETGTNQREIKAEKTMEADTPGVFRWKIATQTMLDHGDGVDLWQGGCSEYYAPVPQSPPTPISNGDEVQDSETPFWFSNSSDRGGNGSDDGVATDPGGSASSRAGGEGEAAAPAPGLAAVMLGLAAALLKSRPARRNP